MSTTNQFKEFQQNIESAEKAITSVLEGKSYDLDLNALLESLAEARKAIIPAANAQAEYDLLHNDLIGRILSMKRAINVALDKHQTESMALASDDIANESAKNLLRLYRQTCVQFRDTFPGNLRYLGAETSPQKDWSEFKSN